MHTKLTKTDLSYLAGFFDGEGSITICPSSTAPRSKNPNHILRVSVGNTNPTIPKLLQSVFGGSLTIRPAVGNCREVFQWMISAVKAITFLNAISPYLRMKTPQYTVAKEFQDSRKMRGPHPVSMKELIWREKQRIKLRKLNGRNP